MLFVVVGVEVEIRILCFPCAPDHWGGAGDHVLPALHGQEHDWGGHHQEGWGAKALVT